MLDAILTYTSTIRALADAGVSLSDDDARTAASFDAVRGIGNGPSPVANLADRILAGAIAPATVGRVVADELAAHAAERAAAAADAREVAKHLARRGVTTIRDHADTNIGQVRPYFDEAADVLARAVAAGITPETDANAAMRLGGEAGTAFLAVPDAVATLDRVRAVVSTLSRTADRPGIEWFVSADSITSGERRRFDITDGGRGGFYVWTDLDAADALPSWLARVHAGFTLHLNTPSDAQAIREKAEKIEADVTAAANRPRGMSERA
jgi:hypothetical protein